MHGRVRTGAEATGAEAGTNGGPVAEKDREGHTGVYKTEKPVIMFVVIVAF